MRWFEFDSGVKWSANFFKELQASKNRRSRILNVDGDRWEVKALMAAVELQRHAEGTAFVALRSDEKRFKDMAKRSQSRWNWDREVKSGKEEFNAERFFASSAKTAFPPETSFLRVSRAF